MRGLIARAGAATTMFAATAAPATADTNQGGPVNVGNVGVGVNVCELNPIVENDDASPRQCTN